MTHAAESTDPDPPDPGLVPDVGSPLFDELVAEMWPKPTPPTEEP